MPLSTIETVEQIYSNWLDLNGELLLNPDAEWFTDGSSLVDKGLRKAGYPIVSLSDVMEPNTLPANSLAQQAELLPSLGHCNCEKDSDYTDSKNRFVIFHAHAVIWKREASLLPRAP